MLKAKLCTGKIRVKDKEGTDKNLEVCSFIASLSKET